MLILVPVKRVPDPYARVLPLPDRSGLDLSDVKMDMNPFDEIAMEEAARKREEFGARVIAVSIGDSACEDTLRKALAMGADEAILIEADEPLDAGVVAAELEALARELRPDLVLMGKQAVDDDTNAAGSMLAARLGWPIATSAAALRLEAGSAEVVCEGDEGELTLRVSLPAVVTADLRLNEPRYIALPGILKARSKPLARRSRLTDARPKTRWLEVEVPPNRPAGRKVASVDELLSELRTRGLV